MIRVVDASVVIKWYVAEEDSAPAVALLGKSFIAPDLLASELSNALWKKWRRREIDAVQALAALDAAEQDVTLVASGGIRRRALELALELSHPAYDCLYLALAELKETTLVTADARLLRACRATKYERLVESP